MAGENVGNLSYSLELDTSKLIDGQRKVEQELNKTANSMGKVDDAAKKASRSADDLGGALGGMAGGFQLAAIAGSILMIGDALRQAQISAEKLSNTLFFANGGDLSKVSDDLEYLRGTAERLGLQFESSAQNFAKFKAAAAASGTSAEQVRVIFDGVSQATTALGLSAQESERAYTALTQMMSKGQVMAEEWKGQLSEAIPIATGVMTKALGVTTAEFNKMMEAGEVNMEMLAKFAVQLQSDTADAANKAADGMQAATNRMGNAWLDLKKTIAESGIGDAIKGIMNEATRSMDGFTQAIKNAKNEGAGFFGQLGAAAKELAVKGTGIGRAAEYFGFTDKALSNAENLNKLLGEQAKARAKLASAKMLFDPNAARTAQTQLDEITKRVVAFQKNTGATGLTTSGDAKGLGAKSITKDYTKEQNDKKLAAQTAFNDKYKSNAAKKNAEILALNKQADAAGLRGSVEYNEALAKIEEKYKPKGGGRAGKGKDPAKEAQKEMDAQNKLHLEAIKQMNDQAEQLQASADKVAAEEEKAKQQKIDKAAAVSQQVGESQMSPALLAANEWAEKLAIIEEAQAVDLENQDAYNLAKLNAELEYQDKIKAIRDQQAESELANNAMVLGAASSMFDGMAGLVETYGNKQSGAYKTMFALSKAFSIAQSAMAIQTGVAKALELGFPANIPAMAQVVSAGAGIMSSIKGMNFGGGRQYGGGVSQGTMYRVNETGAPEMFTASNGKQFMMPTSNGNVTPANQVGVGGGGVQIVINNMAGADVTATASPDGQLVEIAVKRAVAEVAGQFRSNSGQVWNAAKNSTNIQGKTA